MMENVSFDFGCCCESLQGANATNSVRNDRVRFVVAVASPVVSCLALIGGIVYIHLEAIKWA